MTILKVRSFLSKSSHLTFGKEKEMLKQSCMAVESSLAEYPCTERQFNFQKAITLNLITLHGILHVFPNILNPLCNLKGPNIKSMWEGALTRVLSSYCKPL